ncbi:nuclear transport factor 2 family protein [Marinobacterium lutimaris]|uniref:SnoaL-like domain-containing protein n=1 Tax=Marinobacterium lutimaris TaxID=568106 RepID=A0A1H6DM74_9GAMM|nr:nuclear transport factor 2 family protein [Marinobacterium lutimaris]SEG85675.1 SnoaL-like domain-containing protein [Marinobacterium lutimaris]
MSDLDLLQLLKIERDLTRLVLDAAHFADSREFRQLAELFVEEGVLYRPTAPEKPLLGREAIFESYNARPEHRLTRHLCSNFRIDIQNAESARVRCYAQVFGADKREDAGDHLGPPAEAKIMLGEFDDLCVFEAGRWLIAERRASFTLHQPL